MVILPQLWIYSVRIIDAKQFGDLRPALPFLVKQFDSFQFCFNRVSLNIFYSSHVKYNPCLHFLTGDIFFSYIILGVQFIPYSSLCPSRSTLVGGKETIQGYKL